MTDDIADIDHPYHDCICGHTKKHHFWGILGCGECGRCSQYWPIEVEDIRK